jgi:hypothetical protein
MNRSDTVGNKGAWINITRKSPDDESDRPELEYDYKVFEAVPHPKIPAMKFAYGSGMF